MCLCGAGYREAASKRNRDLSCEISNSWENNRLAVPVQVSGMARARTMPRSEIRKQSVPATERTKLLQGVRDVRIRAESPAKRREAGPGGGKRFSARKSGEGAAVDRAG